MGSGGTFVGRDEELRVLGEALAQAQAGRGQLVLVTGEPGIGKTALADALMERAHEAGMRVAFARAWEGGGAPPWWIWTEVWRSLGEPFDLPRTLDGDEARFACFERIAERLRGAASTTTLAVVLDDLQWADGSSLLALKLVARTLRGSRLLVVGTARDPDESNKEIASILAGVRREATILRLGGLPLSAITALADRRGIPSSGALVALRLTGGNALFAREIFEDAEARRALLEGGEPPVPRGVSDVLARRLDRLSPEARDVVAWAAVAADPVDVAVIARAGGLPIAEVTVHVEAAAKEGILSGTRFVHDLFRATAYAALAPDRRAEMHAAIAGVLAARPGTAARVAHHLACADPGATSEDAARAAREAAKEALSKLAYEEAVGFAERAVVLDERAGRRGALADALVLLAEARYLAGDGDGSASAAARAVALAREEGDPVLFARAALAVGLRHTLDRALAPLLDEAVERLGTAGAGDVALSCAVEARLAAALTPFIDSARALVTGRAVIARARASGDPVLLARTLHTARPAFRMLEPYEERYRMDSELLELAGALSDDSLSAYAHGRLFWDALEIGDPLSADVALAAYERLAGKLRVARHQVGSASARAVREAMRGRWAEARAKLDELEATRERWSSTQAHAFAFDPVAIITTMMGPPEEGQRYLETAVGPVPPPFRPVLRMWSLARFGRLDEARALYPAVAGRLAGGEASYALRTIVADVAIRLGERAHAETLYEVLAPLSGHHNVLVPMPGYDGSIDRLLGGLAALSGDRGRAESHYASAIAGEEWLGARAFAERTRRERDAFLGGSPRRSRPSPRAHPELTCEGDTWLVRFAGEEARVKNADGLRYIALLVARPDVAIPVTELFSGKDGGAHASPSDAGEVLDRDAIDAYRSRARDLREAVEDATGRNDTGAAEVARRELDFLEEELRGAIGLGGRTRRAASEVERIRVNVTLRIKKAIAKLQERTPGLAHHLATTIKTGTTCTYRPPPVG